MTEQKLDKDRRLSVLCRIVQAQHFAWRDAVARLHPELDTTAVVKEVRAEEGRQTVDAYLKGVDRNQPLVPQIASALAHTRQAMGDCTRVEVSASGEEALVTQASCAWHQWHKRLKLLDEDRPACDAWFQAAVDHVNEEFGTRLRVETTEALPEGDSRCCRRLFIEVGPGFFD